MNAAPELSLGGDDEVLVERIGMGCDLDPLRKHAGSPNRSRWATIASRPGVEFIDENGGGPGLRLRLREKLID